MNIAEQIQEIVEKRNQQAHNVKNVLENWQKQKVALKKLENQQNNLYSNSEDNSQISQRSNSINFSKFIRQIDRELKELENLYTRLSRPTLNIGVVGRMRQGKSRLLQTLTGLTDIEIPTSSEGVCTRSLSKIFHVNNPDEVRNEVHFHSSSSLQEIIHLYFDKLGLADPKPIVPDDLDAGMNPPPLSPEQAQDIKLRFDYGRLRREYYHKYNHYQSLLDAPLKLISKENIKQYTTQIQGHENTSNGEYLAVKELNIYCQFPDQDQVGRIGVIDLPGLGDDPVSDTELLIKTLKQDIDFILFVRRPDPLGDDWQEPDRDMYKIACGALGDFPISKCSFMLFNRTKLETQDNLNLCNQFQASIDLQEINVTDSVIADCSNFDEVKALVLTPVIEKLTQNINYVHEQYVHSCNQRLEIIRAEIFQHLEGAARTAWQGNQQGGKGFHHWFDKELYPRLTGKIFQKLRQLEEQKNQADTLLEEEVNKVVTRCREDSIIPDEFRIEGFRNAYGDSYKIAYYMCINEVKDKLTDEFRSLAKALTESERKLQLSVVEILSDDGDLKKLTSQRGIEFFDEIEKQLSAYTDKLKQSFQEIKQSNHTYEKTINQWIHPHLDELEPDKHLDPISQKQCLGNNLGVTTEKVNEIEKTVNLTAEQTSQLENSLSNPTADLLSEFASYIMKLSGVPLPDELNQKIASFAIDQISSLIGRVIRNHQENNQIGNIENGDYFPSLSRATLILEEIKTLRDKVVDDCEQTLRKNLSFPNEEAYSRFGKFITQAFRGQDAMIEWRCFYEDEKNQSILWPGAGEKKKNEQVKQEWQKSVDRAVEANKVDALLLSRS